MSDPNSRVLQAVNEVIEQGPEVGMQVAAYLNGELVVDVHAGVADEESGRPVDADTIFTVFSATKGVAATALHLQAERGLIEYDAPMVKYWPEFGANGKESATVLHALTHRAGVPQMPDGTTAEQICDWDGMVSAIAALTPEWTPGERTGYHGYTFGWLVGELVRRTDPQHRPFGQFVQDEICGPLGMDSFWMGIPDEAEPRCARLINTPPPAPDAPTPPPDALIFRAIPRSIGTTQEVFGRPDVRRACIPGAGGITDARSLARHYALLAGLGTLDGTRLLSPERVRLASSLQTDEVDAAMGRPVRKGMGYFLAGPDATGAVGPMGPNPAGFGHPGAGGSIGFCDPDAGLAVAIAKNRMLAPMSPEENTVLKVANAVREALSVTA